MCDLQTEVLLNIDLIFRQGDLLDLRLLDLRLLRAEHSAPDACNVYMLILTVLQDFILPLALQSLVLALLRELLLLKLELQLAHRSLHGVPVGQVGDLDEFKNVVYVRFNFDQLLGRLGLIGTLGTVLVNQGADVADLLGHFLVLVWSHQVLTALGSLQLEHIFLITDPAPSLHVLFHCGLQAEHLSLLLILDAEILLPPQLCLLFVVLPLDDQAEVLLLQVREVLVEVRGLLEGQFVGVVRAVILEERLQPLVVLDFVLGGCVSLHFPLRV